MTVQELKEMLSELPNDAIVMIKHQLVGNECYAESVTFKQNDCHEPNGNGVVWIGEISA